MKNRKSSFNFADFEEVVKAFPLKHNRSTLAVKTEEDLSLRKQVLYEILLLLYIGSLKSESVLDNFVLCLLEQGVYYQKLTAVNKDEQFVMML